MQHSFALEIWPFDRVFETLAPMSLSGVSAGGLTISGYSTNYSIVVLEQGNPALKWTTKLCVNGITFREDPTRFRLSSRN